MEDCAGSCPLAREMDTSYTSSKKILGKQNQGGGEKKIFLKERGKKLRGKGESQREGGAQKKAALESD